jgi:hypothetical protein
LSARRPRHSARHAREQHDPLRAELLGQKLLGERIGDVDEAVLGADLAGDAVDHAQRGEQHRKRRLDEPLEPPRWPGRSGTRR